jgi:hypothetical protein
MAWRMGSVFFIAPGTTISIGFWWPPGTDHGPQWALPHPLPGEPETWLVTERVGKKLVCEIGQVEQNGPAKYSCAGTGSNYEYRVWIRNDGTSGCRFQLDGGSV